MLLKILFGINLNSYYSNVPSFDELSSSSIIFKINFLNFKIKLKYFKFYTEIHMKKNNFEK